MEQSSTAITHATSWQTRVKQSIRVIVKNPTALTGVVIISFWVLMAVLGPALAPYGINEIEQGAVWQAPSAKHIMGTDNLGR